MPNPSVYIETTIVSYLTARPTRDLVRAAHQQITREWWEHDRANYDLFTAPLVLLEAASGNPTAAAERLAELRRLPLLHEGPDAQALAIRLVDDLAIPATASRDAIHVAVAATSQMEYLLTWNCRHLANATLRDRIEQVCRNAGHRPPIICTPEELP